MHEKITIIAEPDAIVRLGFNQEFKEGRTLKYIIKNLSSIFLIMDEDDFTKDWDNSESPLRRFFDAYDIPRPKAISGLLQIYKNPGLCYKLNPFAIWFLNKPVKDLNNFRDLLGVWAINTSELTDDYFYLDHPREYDKDDILDGPKDNGWGNYLEEIHKPFPPCNAFVLNDRHLLYNTNESSALERGFYGLNNLKVLFNEILPRNLRIPFHLIIFCQHPKLDKDKTDEVVNKFITDVKELRSYQVEIEFVYAKSRHKRGLYSNYFWFYVDRGFNAFYNNNIKKFNGENDLNLISYLNNPFTSGDTEYKSSRTKIDKIKEQCKEVYISPHIDEESFENITRVSTDSEDFFDNRLFS